MAPLIRPKNSPLNKRPTTRTGLFTKIFSRTKRTSLRTSDGRSIERKNGGGVIAGRPAPTPSQPPHTLSRVQKLFSRKPDFFVNDRPGWRRKDGGVIAGKIKPPLQKGFSTTQHSTIDSSTKKIIPGKIQLTFSDPRLNHRAPRREKLQRIQSDPKQKQVDQGHVPPRINLKEKVRIRDTTKTTKVPLSKAFRRPIVGKNYFGGEYSVHPITNKIVKQKERVFVVPPKTRPPLEKISRWRKALLRFRKYRADRKKWRSMTKEERVFRKLAKKNNRTPAGEIVHGLLSSYGELGPTRIPTEKTMTRRLHELDMLEWYLAREKISFKQQILREELANVRAQTEEELSELAA